MWISKKAYGNKVGKKSLKYKRKSYGKKLALKKPLKNMYVYKRSAQALRIRHVSGDNGDVWRIEDAAGQLISNYASGAAWGVESILGSYQNGFSLNGRLNFLENVSDFLSLYDRYKILGIKVTFLYQISEATAGGQQILPTIMYAVDNDDNSPPTFSQMRQKQDMRRKILTGNKPFSIYYKPKKLVSQSDLAGVSSSSITSAGWTNCDYPGVNHAGLKFYINNLYSGAAGVASTIQSQLDVQVTYYLAFKDPQ